MLLLATKLPRFISARARQGWRFPAWNPEGVSKVMPSEPKEIIDQVKLERDADDCEGVERALLDWLNSTITQLEAKLA